MSRYSYAGNFQNPADSFFVKEVEEKFYIFVRETRDHDLGPEDPYSKGKLTVERPHTRHLDGGDKSKPLIGGYDDHEEAIEAIESIQQFFEDDYDNYIEENHHAIAQMEAYEAYRNEY